MVKKSKGKDKCKVEYFCFTLTVLQVILRMYIFRKSDYILKKSLIMIITRNGIG